jgi:hypothetical protein
MKLHAGLGVAALAALAGLAQAAAPAAGQLDRAALMKLADDYFAALVAHDPRKVSFAPNAKFVENLKRTKPGEGELWKTASSVPATFRIVIPDPVSQAVGGIVVLGNGANATQLGFRLKLENGRIVEAEHLIQGTRGGGPLNANLTTARPALALEVPFEYADSRGRLIHIAKSYYDALDNNNGYLAPSSASAGLRASRERHAHGAQWWFVADSTHRHAGGWRACRCAACRWSRSGCRRSAGAHRSAPDGHAGLRQPDQLGCLPVHHHDPGPPRRDRRSGDWPRHGFLAFPA